MKSEMRPGRVDWIGLRPGRRLPMLSCDQAELSSEKGLMGDRYEGRSGSRHVTLIGAEDLISIASFLGRPVVALDLRRNIVVRGINLLALKDRQFKLGGAVLEMTAECHPCSRMEEIFGTGGYNAVRGHGGITARVLRSGRVEVGDPLTAL